MTNKHITATALFFFTLFFAAPMLFQDISFAMPQGSPQILPAKTVTGTVLETMDASGYTYMNVDTGEEKVWVAIPKTTVKKDDKVTFYQGTVMYDFVSESLKRTFKSVIFSQGLVGEGSAPQPPARMPSTVTGSGDSFASAVAAEGGQPTSTDAIPNMSGGSAAAVAAPAEVKIEKAEGQNSYTVAELFDKAKELNGQKIHVKGKVVKFSPGIMGKNWIHLQDGTGDSAKRTHDLVVTTMDQSIKVNDIITVEGVLAADKDFGAGYRYAVIIEEATVAK